MSDCQGQGAGAARKGRFIANEDTIFFAKKIPSWRSSARTRCATRSSSDQRAAHTGNAGDGVIMVADLPQVVRIRTAQEQDEAMGGRPIAVRNLPAVGVGPSRPTRDPQTRGEPMMLRHSSESGQARRSDRRHRRLSVLWTLGCGGKALRFAKPWVRICQRLREGPHGGKRSRQEASGRKSRSTNMGLRRSSACTSTNRAKPLPTARLKLESTVTRPPGRQGHAHRSSPEGRDYFKGPTGRRRTALLQRSRWPHSMEAPTTPVSRQAERPRCAFPGRDPHVSNQRRGTDADRCASSAHGGRTGPAKSRSATIKVAHVVPPRLTGIVGRSVQKPATSRSGKAK